jgi:hypothetical protein
MLPARETQMRFVIGLWLLLWCASVAHAQSTFVSGSVTGELARFGSVETEPSIGRGLDTSLDGDTVGFGVAIERALGERWGVALEFVRPGSISGEDSYQLPIVPAIFPPLPPIEIQREFEHRRLSWNTMAWLTHPLGDRVSLAFYGGLSFTRTRLELIQLVTVPALVLLRPGVIDGIAPASITIDYSVDPVVGLDARIRLNDRFAVVPGVRVQSGDVGGSSGWLFRPSVGLRYGF